MPEEAAVVASKISPPPPAHPSPSSHSRSGIVVPSTTATAAAVYQLSRRKRKRVQAVVATTTKEAPAPTKINTTVMLGSSENSSLLVSQDNDATADNTLLRRLLAGADMASVRNHSVLVDGNFSLRRTSSMSQHHGSSSSSSSNPDASRPRRSTMFCQFTLSRTSPPGGGSSERDAADGSDDGCHPPVKRIKDECEIVSSGGSSPMSVKVVFPSKGTTEAPSDNATANTTNSSISAQNAAAIGPPPPELTSTRSTIPMKPTQRWRLARQHPSNCWSPPAMPSVDINGAPKMRPRARTASELDKDLRLCAQRLVLSQANNPSVECLRSMCHLASTVSRSLEEAAAAAAAAGKSSGCEKPSDMTSPLSQLLESTPPYTASSSSAASSSSLIHTRANTICSLFPWSSSTVSTSSMGPAVMSSSAAAVSASPGSSRTNNSNTITTTAPASTKLCLPFLPGDSNLRIMSTANPSKPPDLQVLELNKNSIPSAAGAMASFLAATSRQILQGLRDEQQVLDFSRKEAPPAPNPPLPLALATDDILQWSTAAASQAATLQQLFSLPSSGGGAAGSSATSSNSRPNVTPDDSQTARLPIRLSAVNPLLLCRRVAEWLLFANAWTMQLCPHSLVPPNALLATAANYRYCRCSESELQAAPPITPTLVLPRVSPSLRAVLHRIWPQLLLASMVRENFAFSVAPIPPGELNFILGREAALNGTVGGGGGVGNHEVNIARMGTATALKSLIEAGNPLLLDTQVLECVRKCIFAQRELLHLLLSNAHDLFYNSTL